MEASKREENEDGVHDESEIETHVEEIGLLNGGISAVIVSNENLAQTHGSQNFKVSGVPGPVPPDGGCRGYMVMFASFLCNGIIFGTINSGGVIFDSLHEILTIEGIENPAAQASLTLSLAIGTTFFLSMVSGVLTDKFGIRITTVVGGIIATLGMFLSSLCFKQPALLTVSMGLIFGIGASLAYTPSLVILGHYFVKKIGIVNGFVTAGSSVATILITWLLTYEIENHGLKAAFQVLSGLMTILMLSGFIFKPYLPPPPKVAIIEHNNPDCGSKCRGFWSQFINFEIWRNKKYVIWTLAIPSALFGYFVPYVHLKKYAQNVLGEDSHAEVIVQVIGGASGVGRLVFGLFADRPGVNRILLQQISFFSIGALTMLLTLADNMYVFCAIATGMGLFDGCFISLLGPIAFDIVGAAGASQAIGCLLALCALPLTLGPFIAGVMYDKLGSYTIPFLCAGIPPIFGCFALCFLRCAPEKNEGPVNSSDTVEKGTKNNEGVIPEGESLVQGSTDKPANGESLKVDVTKLVNLQRESSV